MDCVSVKYRTVYLLYWSCPVSCKLQCTVFKLFQIETINPNPHGMFWTKVIYDLASSEPYSLSSLNSKNLKKIRKCP